MIDGRREGKAQAAALLRSLDDAAQVGIYALDRYGFVTRWACQMPKWTGVGPAEILGKRLNDALPGSPPQWEKAHADALRGARVLLQNVPGRLHRYRFASIEPLVERGEIVGVLGTLWRAL